ncbi:EamA domain-containing membrane protein RarD [Mesocricetibacter intestinalis]|uniref:EamA domain-containing membrane protein RarD n=1 Tax=Mesocricetibacter intestinalis TaxID=1521930 RepID=A0A4R6V9A0_9PAST|nr:DMT family transporter [Mesocricetibacter intestinalis]TDQ58080.1 EamA domain-containing membrane protein RarD [Mesocricetibacter intestinalis]
MDKYYGQLLMVMVTLIGASGWFLSKNAIAELPPVGFMGLRFLLAGLIFLLPAYGQLRAIDSRQFLCAASVGSALALNLFLWVLGITYSNDFGEGAFLVSLSMLIAPLVSWLLFKHKPLLCFWLSMPIALFGLYFLAMASGASGPSFSVGSLIFLLSSLSAALYFVLNNQYAKNIATLALIVIQFFIVGSLCSGYSLLFETWPEHVSVQVWGWFWASTLIATNLRYWLQTAGQKRCNITTAAMLMVLEPVWTLIVSVLFFSESLSLDKFIGCGLILSALIIYRLQSLSGRKKIRG